MGLERWETAKLRRYLNISHIPAGNTSSYHLSASWKAESWLSPSCLSLIRPLLSSPPWPSLGQTGWDKRSVPPTSQLPLPPSGLRFCLERVCRKESSCRPLKSPGGKPMHWSHARGAGSENHRSGRPSVWAGPGRRDQVWEGGGVSPLPVVRAEASESVPAKEGGR